MSDETMTIAVTQIVFLVAIALLVPAEASAQYAQRLQPYGPRLEKILKENIIPFWMNKSLDRKYGGYMIDIDPKGEPKGTGTKMIVTQSRQLWLFSRLVNAGFGGKEFLDAAELGYRFLKERMLDSKSGGFYWEVDPAGTKRLRPRKHLYGQAFALYALSEYYLASHKKDVLDLAAQTFNIMETKAHDPQHGGYNEFFNEDWTPAPADADSYMGGKSGFKLMNTHLHLLEAVTGFYRASRLPLARERLLELIAIETNSVVRKGLGACTDKYDPDWTPRLEGSFARVSYGHDIENVWLVMDACNAAGISNYPYLDLYRSLWDYSLKYGYDESGGGFYESGTFNQPADNRDKVWWVQAEAIVSALHMYRVTKDPKLIPVFEKTFNFIEKYLCDWQTGEWHERVRADGKAQGDKATPWKAGYHNGRAMIECLTLLRELTK